MNYKLQYYDLILGLIAASLALGIGIGGLTPIGIVEAVVVASLIAVGLIGHALFINGPVDDIEDLTKEVEPQKVPGLAHTVEAFDSG